MAGSVNKVILVGNVGKDPEVRSTQDGSKICNLSVATSESWTDKGSGERKERTEWNRVVIYNDGIAGIAEKYLKKGSKVFIEGSLQTRKWSDQQGQDRYSTEVVIQKFVGQLVLLGDAGGGDKAGGHQPSSGSGQQTQQRTAPQERREAPKGKDWAGDGSDMSDEIPF
jgi:single-strand DNA-binding protein